MPKRTASSKWSFSEIRDLDSTEIEQAKSRFRKLRPLARRQLAWAAVLTLPTIPAIGWYGIIGAEPLILICTVFPALGIWLWLKGNDNSRLQSDLKTLTEIPKVARFASAEGEWVELFESFDRAYASSGPTPSLGKPFRVIFEDSVRAGGEEGPPPVAAWSDEDLEVVLTLDRRHRKVERFRFDSTCARSITSPINADGNPIGWYVSACALTALLVLFLCQFALFLGNWGFYLLLVACAVWLGLAGRAGEKFRRIKIREGAAKGGMVERYSSDNTWIELFRWSNVIANASEPWMLDAEVELAIAGAPPSGMWESDLSEASTPPNYLRPLTESEAAQFTDYWNLKDLHYPFAGADSIFWLLLDAVAFVLLYRQHAYGGLVFCFIPPFVAVVSARRDPAPSTTEVSGYALVEWPGKVVWREFVAEHEWTVNGMPSAERIEKVREAKRRDAVLAHADSK